MNIYIAVYNHLDSYEQDGTIYFPGHVGSAFDNKEDCRKWADEKDNPGRWLIVTRYVYLTNK